MLVAIMETIYVRSGDEEYKKMAKFWGKIFLINFVVGVVTGITLEFQFGTNWAGYSKYVGDIFGSLLAIEATTSFFLESTFIAIWVFGWDRVSPKTPSGMHLACCHCCHWFRVLDSGGQFLDATPGWVCAPGRSCGAG